MVPLLGEIDVKIGFRPEGLAPKPAVTAAKGQVAASSKRINAAAAADTMDILGHEAGFRRAFSDEPEPIGITGNLHFIIPHVCISRADFSERGCLTIRNGRSATTIG